MKISCRNFRHHCEAVLLRIALTQRIRLRYYMLPRVQTIYCKANLDNYGAEIDRKELSQFCLLLLPRGSPTEWDVHAISFQDKHVTP